MEFFNRTSRLSSSAFFYSGAQKGATSCSEFKLELADEHSLKG
jgi:hypothetical protein